MSIWRPFEDVRDNAKQEVEGKAKQERMKIRVGEIEKEIVLDAYIRKSHEGWKAVLNEAKMKISASNMNMRIHQFYIKEEENKVLRRIQRIVREETKNQAAIYHQSRDASEKRKSFENSDDDDVLCEQDGKHFKGNGKNAEPPGETTSLVDKQMRYARKITPEERVKIKLGAFVDSDEDSVEEAVCLVKKKKTLREASLEAQNAHSKMCEASMKTMGLMADVLKKLEQKLDE